MRRFAPLLLLLGAAGPQYQGSSQGPIMMPAMSMQSILQRPAAPPAAPAPVFQPAPMPDQDAAAPVTISKAQAELSPKMFSNKTQFRGDGFTSNSTSQVSEERKMKPAGGFALTMPLQ
jgi:hypothetical protein